MKHINKIEAEELLREIAQNGHQTFRLFRSRLAEFCMNRKNGVLRIFRILKGLEMELEECRDGHVHVDVDVAIIEKVLKTVRMEIEIIRLGMENPSLHGNDAVKLSGMVGKWTGDKLDLIELIYAISKTKSVNNGKISLIAIQKGVEYMFGVELGNISNRLAELETRKENKNLYLELLLRNLSHFLDDLNL
jgi:hypothetical protein